MANSFSTATPAADTAAEFERLRGSGVEEESSSEATTRYEVGIDAITYGSEEDQGIVEGTLKITEYVNDVYVSHVAITTSVIGEKGYATENDRGTAPEVYP